MTFKKATLQKHLNKIGIIREYLRDFDDYKAEIKDAPLLKLFKNCLKENLKLLFLNCKLNLVHLMFYQQMFLNSHLNDILPLSLKHGVFPLKWKQAIVRPLIKKIGLELKL